jgi:N-acetylmuramoyl-L-alanine amidase
MNNENRNSFGNNNEDRFSTLDIDGINDIYYQEVNSAAPNNNQNNHPQNSTRDLLKIVLLLLSIIILIIIIYTAIVGILGSGNPTSSTTPAGIVNTLPTTSTNATTTLTIQATTTSKPALTTTAKTTSASTTSTTTASVYNPAYENAVIFIDAGHGGKDVGAVGELDGMKIYEENINLTISLLVRDELEKRGFTVVMSRETDVFIELAERVDMANAAKADMFVSLHCNSAVPAAYGTRILYTDRSVSYKKIKFAGYFEKAIEEFANLYDKMRKDVFVRSDKEESGYYLAVLRDTNMPSILIEMGFITNESDLRLFLNENWQRDIAYAIADAIEKAYNAGMVTKK